MVNRNVFNSEGEIPDETENTQTGETKTDTEFDENAKCQKTSLNIELVGTIYLGRGAESLATVKEKGYNIADIYKEGDRIFGHETAVIHGIFPKKVVINNVFLNLPPKFELCASQSHIKVKELNIKENI